MMPAMDKQPHLLVVDDDREIRTLISQFLTRHGYRVSSARDGAEMMQVLETSRIDLIVLDLMMPGEDGLALCRRLRAQPGPAGAIPIIMLTAMGEALAPLDLYLSSDRGLYPTYRRGDQIRLVLQTNRDAHLYCYLRLRNGLIPIFPSYQSDGSLVKGHTPLTFPGDRMPLPLSASELGGDGEVRCFSAEQELPSSLSAEAQAFRPMDGDAVERLEATLDGLKRTRLVVAQIVLRVE